MKIKCQFFPFCLWRLRHDSHFPSWQMGTRLKIVLSFQNGSNHFLQGTGDQLTKRSRTPNAQKNNGIMGPGNHWTQTTRSKDHQENKWIRNLDGQWTRRTRTPGHQMTKGSQKRGISWYLMARTPDHQCNKEIRGPGHKKYKWWTNVIFRGFNSCLCLWGLKQVLQLIFHDKQISQPSQIFNIHITNLSHRTIATISLSSLN